MTVEEIATAIGMATSTTYRHVRALVQAGFLDPVSGAGYALGPGFIRYDRVLRQNDQLIHIAEPAMRELLARTSQNAVVLLCRRFKDCVMCVHDIEGAAPHVATSYERGVAMPMFLGATSKAILANLPDRTLKNVYLANEAVIHSTLKVHDWATFKKHFREIRRAGYALTDSEIVKGRVGIAAPISRGDQVVAGISLAGITDMPNDAALTEFITEVKSAAARISAGLSSLEAPRTAK